MEVAVRRVRLGLVALAAGVWACAALAAAPQFSAAGVVNAASYAAGGVAPGGIVTIFGSGLGPARPAGMQLTADHRRVTTTLAETRVLFDGIAAPLIYVSETQVSAVVPLALASPSATRIEVEYRGQPSPAVSVPVAAVSPGIFTLNASGRGQGAVLNCPSYKVNGPGNAARKGSVVSVYATAGGWTSPPAEDGRVAEEALPLDQVGATLGSVPAPVLYAGAAPGLVTGVLQVNILVASQAPLGDAVPLEIIVNGVRSQSGVTLALEAGSTATGIALASPYLPKAQVYSGQLHVHTTQSDGAQDSATVVRAYKDAGYDFISITDHERVTPDPGVAGIAFIPGVEQSPQGNHLNRINVSAPLRGDEQSLIDHTLAEGGFLFLNHPNWPGGYPANPNWTDAELEAVRGYHGIEVWNSLVAPNSNAEGRADYLLSRGRRFFLVATDDCHNVTNSRCKTASTRVFADRAEAGDLMENLKAGNFYASNGAAIVSISVLDRTITVTTDRVSTIEFLAAGGRVVQSSQRVFAAAYTVAGDEIYMRARVTREADKKMAWSNPVYVDPAPGK